MGNQHHKPLRSALVAEQRYPASASPPRILTNHSRQKSSDKKHSKKVKKRQKEGLCFGPVHVRSYSRTVGESVSGGGPAVGLGWDVYSEKNYKTLEAHEKNVLMPRYRERGQLGRLPSRDRKSGIIEFQSLQDEYWIPPNKRHALLLQAGMHHSDVLASVKSLDDLRELRKVSNSDRDALAFALALHHNMTEEEVLARLNPSVRPQPNEPPGMVLPKISLKTNVMITMKLKAKARQAIRNVALRSRKRRSSVARTQVRGLRTAERKKWGSSEDLSATATAAAAAASTQANRKGRGRRRKVRRTSIVEVQTESGDTYLYDDPALGGTGESAWDINEMEQLLGVSMVRMNSDTNISAREESSDQEQEQQSRAVALSLVQEDEEEDEDVEVIFQQPTLKSGRRKKQRRTSVVQIQQDDGTSYWYDDPDLGGSGKSAWEREELEILEDGENENENEVTEQDGEEKLDEEETLEEPTTELAMPQQRRRNKRTKRPSVVQIEQENGTSYFYDDPDLGGSGKSAWLREELDTLDEGAGGEEEEEEAEEEELEVLGLDRTRTRSRSATALKCTIDGCDTIHRYPDGHCARHRNSV
jgi:hypothetical protein